MIADTKKKIVTYIQIHKQVRVHDLVREFGLSRVAIHKQLKNLTASGTVVKMGKPPFVFYVLAEKKDEVKTGKIKNTFKDIFGKELSKDKTPYKEPVFLFTSCSLRFAAYAGWYSAFGEKEKAEQWIHKAHTEWAKEIAATRRFSFFDSNNSDMYKYISEDTMKQLIDRFCRLLKSEISKGKTKEKKFLAK